jgi:hypothetical protein
VREQASTAEVGFGAGEGVGVALALIVSGAALFAEFFCETASPFDLLVFAVGVVFPLPEKPEPLQPAIWLRKKQTAIEDW